MTDLLPANLRSTVELMLGIELCGGGILLWLCLLVFWAGEHFAIQASLYKAPPITRHPLLFLLPRILINLAFAMIFLMLLHPIGLLVVFGVDYLLSLVVIGHQLYFRRPLSLFLQLGNIREFIRAIPYGRHIIPPKVHIGMLGCLIIKCALALSLHPHRVDGHQGIAWLAVCVILGLLVCMVIAMQWTSFHFANIRTSFISRPIYAYGYTISWIADFFFAPKTHEMLIESNRRHAHTTSRLSGKEVPWPVKQHVVILQIESLGWNVLHHRIDGREITPFLNRLTASSRVFKVAAFHDIGTADMDYAVLSGKVPSRHTVTYGLPGLDYQDALPRFMNEHGYRTLALHGVTGTYYNRRSNFESIGWDEMMFHEEFKVLNAKQSYWGVRDEALFRYSSERLQRATENEFHFIITMDSHGPFNLISEEEKTIFPGSSNWKENYFNSMATVDRNVQQYVESLPAGTLLICYGDHTANISYGDFTSCIEHGVEYVPCIVHLRPGDGIDPLPVHERPKTSKPLNILDLIGYLREQIGKGV